MLDGCFCVSLFSLRALHLFTLYCSLVDQSGMYYAQPLFTLLWGMPHDFSVALTHVLEPLLNIVLHVFDDRRSVLRRTRPWAYTCQLYYFHI